VPKMLSRQRLRRLLLIVGVVQNLSILGNTCARKSPASEGRISVSWPIVLFRRRRALPAQARWGCSGPSPSNVSQWG
jgi:hypothetical protein